jgi:transcription antitermination factor NusG
MLAKNISSSPDSSSDASQNPALQPGNWYILKTKSNREKKVNESLQIHGFTTYLPTYTTMRIWSDRKKKIEAPLIPGYVFVHCTPEKLLQAAKTIGVAWIVRDLKDYAVVKDYEIQNLRIYLSDSYEPKEENLDEYQGGETVKVTHGPFKGMIGTALHKQGEYRIRIEIDSIGANFSMNMPKSQLEKI